MVEIYLPTRVYYGAGAIERLRQAKLPGKKALLVTSNGTSAEKCGGLGKLLDIFAESGTAFVRFAEIEANPLKDTVMRAAAAARREGCDFVVALGGGSVMDASKAIAAMATSDGDLWDYVGGGTGKGKPLAADPLPLVAITTTAGTGSEVDSCGVITNPETHEKIGFGGDARLFPVISVVDPDLMLTVPPRFTAFQGFDALFHSTEGFISSVSNPMSDLVEREAIRRIGESLARAVRDGSDGEARASMALANTLSGYSMELASCTSEHSLEHAMSAYHQELPHGAGLIMISLAYYGVWIERHVADERFVEMARLLGIPDASRPEQFLDALLALQRACGVDGLKMSDYGITPEEFPVMAKNARDAMGRLFDADPGELTQADCEEIYRRSYR